MPAPGFILVTNGSHHSYLIHVHCIAFVAEVREQPLVGVKGGNLDLKVAGAGTAIFLWAGSERGISVDQSLEEVTSMIAEAQLVAGPNPRAGLLP